MNEVLKVGSTMIATKNNDTFVDTCTLIASLLR